MEYVQTSGSCHSINRKKSEQQLHTVCSLFSIFIIVYDFLNTVLRIVPIFGGVPYKSTPTRYIFADRIPTPTVEPISTAMEIAISYQATVLIQIRVNIAIGEVNGIYEQTFISTVSTLPPVIENITIKNAMINKKVIGITEVLISSNFDAVEPIAPYKKA